MKSFAGRVAAVTGAASGIGRALAIELVQRGADVALSDVDTDGLATTAAQCEGFGNKVSTRKLDVADREAVEAWATEVVDIHGRVNAIFNNAGVAVGSTVRAMSYDDLSWLMGVNFWGVIHGTMSFLPHLEAAGEGHIVNISSVFGLVSIPSQSAYNASKFAVRGFSDALRMELEIAGSPVSVTTVHPGGIRTNIARSARVNESVRNLSADPAKVGEEFDRLARTSPEAAARQILRAVNHNRRRVLVGPDAHVFDLAARLPSSVFQRLLIAGARRRIH